MENLNLAELLKGCPRGMELDCTVYDNCTLETVFEGCLYPIQIQTPEGLINLTKYGSMSQSTHSKCVIFPKGKTTWEGFVPPYQFKDGDIVAVEDGSWVGITEGGKNSRFIPTYCVIKGDGEFKAYFTIKEKWCFDRLATEEEKQKIFDAIKANGYCWNAETKTLEKMVEPKFEVGNKIEKYGGYRFTIAEVKDDYYLTKCGNKIPFDNQDDFSLVPNKFDITTLKPFVSRVLVRDNNCDEWEADIFGRYSDGYITLGGIKWKQCIPFKGNEHLLGTTDDCYDFYKTWENNN